MLEYKYFIANFLGLLPLLTALFIAKRLRHTAVICGLTLVLYSPPVSWLYEGVYWAPPRVFGGSWGLEDAIFCFHAGAMSWLCAFAPWGSRFKFSPRVTVAARRLLVISVFATAALLVFLATGFTVLSAFLTTQTISTVIILSIRPEYLRVAVPGTILFMVYYFLLLGLWKLLMPGFMDMWSGTELAGGKVLGIPVEEYLWVLSFSTGFPITMAFALDARSGSALASTGSSRRNRSV
jgi:hypothetical protein